MTDTETPESDDNEAAVGKIYTFVMTSTVNVSINVEAKTVEDAVDMLVDSSNWWSLCRGSEFKPEEGRLIEVWEEEKIVPLDQLQDLWPGRIR